ncbi:MAG: hypothetical protein ACXIUZ_03110 [Lysobacteraceae bacterium]
MGSLKARQAVLASIGALGALVFTFFFALTVHTPVWVERFAADFIEQEVARQIDQRIDGLQPPGGEHALSRMAGALYESNAREIERRRELLRNQVHERMADSIARVRDLDCECRAKWASWIEAQSDARIQLLEQTNRTLVDFIQGTYARVVTELKRDIRIFAGTNAVLFLLLLVIAFAKPRAVVQLFVPGLLLASATLACSYFYIFQQNWLLTIIYSDYLGMAYLGYLFVVFALLCDVVLNKARVTTAIANTVFSAIGKAATAVPC